MQIGGVKRKARLRASYDKALEVCFVIPRVLYQTSRHDAMQILW